MADNTAHVSAVCPNCGLFFLSAEDAARLIGVSYSRVRAILEKKPERLRAFKVGNTWLIPEEAARQFRPLPPHRPRKEAK